MRGPRPQGAVIPGIQQHVAWRQRIEHVRGHLLDQARPLGGEARPFPGERRGLTLTLANRLS
jgi:hypothetical protein